MTKTPEPELAGGGLHGGEWSGKTRPLRTKPRCQDPSRYEGIFLHLTRISVLSESAENKAPLDRYLEVVLSVCAFGWEDDVPPAASLECMEGTQHLARS